PVDMPDDRALLKLEKDLAKSGVRWRCRLATGSDTGLTSHEAPLLSRDDGFKALSLSEILGDNPRVENGVRKRPFLLLSTSGGPISWFGRLEACAKGLGLTVSEFKRESASAEGISVVLEDDALLGERPGSLDGLPVVLFDESEDQSTSSWRVADP